MEGKRDVEYIAEMMERAGETFELGEVTGSSGEKFIYMEFDAGMLGFTLWFDADGQFDACDAPEWY